MQRLDSMLTGARKVANLNRMKQGWIFLALSIVMFGSWGIFAKWSQQKGASPWLLTLLTAVGTAIIGIALCAPLTDWASLRSVKQSLLPGLLAGLSVGLGNICLYKALQTVPVSIALPLSGIYILVTVLLAVIFLKETLTLIQSLGVCFAVLAIVFLSWTK